MRPLNFSMTVRDTAHMQGQPLVTFLGWSPLSCCSQHIAIQQTTELLPLTLAALPWPEEKARI